MLEGLQPFLQVCFAWFLRTRWVKLVSIAGQLWTFRRVCQLQQTYPFLFRLILTWELWHLNGPLVQFTLVEWSHKQLKILVDLFRSRESGASLAFSPCVSFSSGRILGLCWKWTASPSMVFLMGMVRRAMMSPTLRWTCCRSASSKTNDVSPPGIGVRFWWRPSRRLRTSSRSQTRAKPSKPKCLVLLPLPGPQ